MSAERYDVVIAGGGHNALLCGAYLARAGQRVLVLEANPQIGGNTSTEEMILPGFRFDTGSGAHVLFQASPTWRNKELDLERYGLHYYYPDPVLTMPFEDGNSLTMWRDIDHTVEEIAHFSAHDAQAYRKLISDYDAVKKHFGEDRYTPAGYGPSMDERLSALPDGALWMRRYRQSAFEVVKSLFEEQHVRTFILWLASLTAQPIDAPYTGILAYSIANGRQHNSWVTPAGGSVALPKALSSIIGEHQGCMLTGKQVTGLILEEGRCVGVRTADGDSFRGEKAVVSSIHIRHLVEMAPEEAWGPNFVEYVQGWQSGFTYFVAQYALSQPPLFEIDGSLQPVAAAGMAGSIDNLLQHMCSMRQGKLHQETPVLLVTCPSVPDPSRAPDGMHTLRLMATFPYDLKDGGPQRWDEIKEETAERNLNYLCHFVPNISEEVILGRQIDSPLDLERRNLHNWRGSCHGGEATPAQSGMMRPVPGWASHRMPIPGLYQTGATTHPGGSVSGGPGRNAAMVVLEDLGLTLADAIKGEGKDA